MQRTPRRQLFLPLSVESFPNGEGEQYTNAIPVTVALPAPPNATLKFNGASVSGTQTAVIGEQIALTASVAMPACMTLASQSWTPPSASNAVGGFPATSASGAATPISKVSTTGSGYTFYWITAGNPLSVTYQYTMTGDGASVNGFPQPQLTLM